MRNPLLMIKKKDQRELVFQRLKNSQQKNVVNGQRVPVRLSAMSNLRQSRKNTLLNISMRNLNNNLMSICKSKAKRSYLIKMIQSQLRNLRSKSNSQKQKKLLMIREVVLIVILNTNGSKINWYGSTVELMAVQLIGKDFDVSSGSTNTGTTRIT